MPPPTSAFSACTCLKPWARSHSRIFSSAAAPAIPRHEDSRRSAGTSGSGLTLSAVMRQPVVQGFHHRNHTMKNAAVSTQKGRSINS
jgi:hypothetical protein